MLARLGGVDLTLTTNGALLAKQGARAARRGPEPRHREPRLARRRDLPRDERRRLSGGASVLEGIDAAAAAGLAPIKINMVVKRGVNEHAHRADGAALPRHGHIVRFIEYMDVGTTNGWRMDDVVPSAEDRRSASIASCRSSRSMPNYPGEVARALALSRRRRARSASSPR